MELLFNELSASGAYQAPALAREGMGRALEVARAVFRLGVERTIRTTTDFMERELAPDYRIAQWLCDNDVDREARRLVKAAAARSPFLEDLLAREEEEQALEIVHEDAAALGLGVAFLWGYPALSLDGDARFAGDPVTVTVRRLDDTGALVEEAAEVCCLTDLGQVGRREAWVREGVRREVQSGANLWERRATVVPNLVFCKDTHRQLTEMTGHEVFFRQVTRHLFALDSYVARWTEGPFALQDIDWSEESSATLRHRDFGPLRQFVCPDGMRRVFSHHTKLHGANMRIHFHPVQADRRAFVGYVGPHLPTVTFRT